MAIEADGIVRRIERLLELSEKFEKESVLMARQGGELLTFAEHQDYLKGVREAADGLERGARVLADTHARVTKFVA